MIESSSILTEVSDERKRQDEKWGGPPHDDLHSPGDWLLFITKQVGDSVYPFSLENYRKNLVQIAALAVAAVEALDRNTERPEDADV